MAQPTHVDPRGLRFAAALTSVVLAAALVTPQPVAIALLVVQGVIFALSAFVGLGASPYGWAFRTFVRPRIGAPDHTEAAEAPTFAQRIGFGFVVVALAGYVVGAPIVGLIATGFALAAALLNATVGLCLGCELYLITRRLRTSATA